MLRLFQFLKPFAASVAAVLALVFLQTLAELYLPNLMSHIVDTGIVQGDTAYIMRVGGYMLAVALGGTLCAIVAGYLTAKSAVGFGKNLRSRVFSHVEGFSANEVNKIGTASLITRTTNDITQVQMFVIIMLRMMVMAPMMAIGGITMAVQKDATLSLVLVFAVPVLAAVILGIARRGMPLFRAQQAKLDKLNLVLRENLTGVRVIRAFDRVDHEKSRLNEANRDLTDTAVKANRVMAALMPTMTLLISYAMIAIVWFGGIRIDEGHMQVGDLMAFIQYAMQIMFSLMMGSLMFVMIPRASASAARINEVLSVTPKIVDRVFDRAVDRVADPAVDQAQAKRERAGEKRGLVEFRDVTFSYPGAEQPVLSHVSFTVGPGEVTAIIGGTGSGKSTLISLIPRFHDVDSGSVLVDGADVRDMPLADLRSRIGFVPQKAVLFTGTIAENIRYGKEDATIDEVRRAAEIAQATEFVSGLKDGFDSIIAQGGTNVSGGQKQRLAIARALVRRPEVYVFDDSFSALDFKTDAKLRSALKKATVDATVLIVAQRVGTVMDADRIIVLEEGRIAGIGVHKELLRTCEVYREIVSSQLSPEEIA